MMSTIKLNTIVSWSTKSAVTTAHVGKVVAVVPAHTKPDTVKYPLGRLPGAPRNHVSYIVQVKVPTSLGVTVKYYWPVVSQLRPQTPDSVNKPETPSQVSQPTPAKVLSVAAEAEQTDAVPWQGVTVSDALKILKDLVQLGLGDQLTVSITPRVKSAGHAQPI